MKKIIAASLIIMLVSACNGNGEKTGTVKSNKPVKMENQPEPKGYKSIHQRDLEKYGKDTLKAENKNTKKKN